MKIDFIKKGGPYGDATSSYEVTFPKGTTLREFIIYITDTYSIEHGEWGSFSLSNTGYFGNIFADYKRGAIRKITDKWKSLKIDSFLDSKLTKVIANGGWSNMDYHLYTEDVE